ncbi:DMT family transporter [Lactiplantibacillus paraxiangfangensis]|uniref:DMT family transporter n=1 Tax=Lactiplantibacillus paraxiangfangensis TaxID=3076224 RepID=UPI0030C6E948
MTFSLAILIGIFLPVQTAVNSKLRIFVKSPYLSSMISFLIATVFLVLTSLLTHSSLLISSRVMSTIPWWAWLGGVVGVIGLTANILLFPILGSVQTVIMPILGQILMSLLIDNFGWFRVAQKPLDFLKIIGALVLIVGVILIVVVPTLGTSKAKDQPKSLWLWQIAGVLAGMLVASQSAINGELGLVLHSSMHAALISFAVGSIILLIIVGLFQRKLTDIRLAFGQGKPWWIWIGGFLGALFVFGNAYLVPIIGTGALVVFALLGQMLGSLVVDQFGLLGATVKKIVPIQIVGIIVMFVGVALIEVIS